MGLNDPDKGKRLAMLCRELELARESKREAMREHNDRITDLQDRVHRLATEIATGQRNILDDQQ